MRLSIENKSKMEMFVALFQLLKNWGSYLNLHFEKTRLYIQSMDKSHVCLSSITISSHWFSSYQIEETTNISLDSTNFAIMMSYALKHNKMEINFATDRDLTPDELDNLEGNLTLQINEPTNEDNEDETYETKEITYKMERI